MYPLRHLLPSPEQGDSADAGCAGEWFDTCRQNCTQSRGCVRSRTDVFTRRELMTRFVSVLTCLTMFAGYASVRPAVAAETVKGGLEEVGEAVKRDSKEAIEKSKEEIERGTRATERGVGEALDKTGKG